jgi:hypothetical protein
LLDAANRALEKRDPDRRILPISVVKVLVEFYGTDVISKTVQIADTIVTVEKDRRPSLREVITRTVRIITRTPTTGAECAVRTGGERRQSANHWHAITRPGLMLR